MSYKNCRQNQITYFLFFNLFSKSGVYHKITRKNLVQPNRPQMPIQYHACALLFGCLRLQSDPEYVEYLLLPYGNICDSKAPQFYVMPKPARLFLPSSTRYAGFHVRKYCCRFLMQPSRFKFIKITLKVAKLSL